MKPSEKRREIQRILGVTADGIFGPKTRAAFQALATEPDSKPIFGVEFDGEYSEELREHYWDLWQSMQINTWASEKLSDIISTARRNYDRYHEVSAQTGVPWRFIAAIHSMESSQSFSKHLHNGDPLTERTVRFPRGRPPEGNPPFTWEESAKDALLQKGFGMGYWDTTVMLYRLEMYNGWGYRKYHPHVLSPYLWSGSNHYTKGKYASDGKFDANLVSKQVGAALILKELFEA